MTTAGTSLAGRVALVTGGASGIGAEVVATLAAHGADVAIACRPGGEARAEAAAEEARARRPEARTLAVPFDVAEVSAAGATVERVERELGPVGILVNSAGTNVPQPALEVDEQSWDEVVDVNLKGLFFSCQALARRVRERAGADDEPWTSIVNVASQMGLVGYHRRAAYCASKAGVVNLTRVLAIEWAPLRIRVNAVAPSFITTPLAEPMLAEPGFRDEVLARTPMGRIGTPAEVAEGVLYLASDASSLVTGHTLSIDGGWTAW